jgi:two-component system chemotaxis response regulator CheY
VLIVEDSPTMRALLVSALEGLPRALGVTEVASGFEALRRLPRERFDLIVTDVNMPDINGLELVSFLRRNPVYARVPVVIVSTEGSERDREKGMALGADAYLVKPFEPEEVQRVVEALLERARGRPEGAAQRARDERNPGTRQRPGAPADGKG